LRFKKKIKYSDSQKGTSIRIDSQTSIDYQEKDQVYYQYEEMNRLNQRTKQIYVNISKESFDLFDCLLKMKLNNKKIYQKNKVSHMLHDHQDLQDKEDILQSLTNDIDLEEEIIHLDLNDQGNNETI